MGPSDETAAGSSPNLLVTSPAVSEGSPAAGARFTLSATVTNAGGGASEATTLRYYRSTDATTTASDVEVGTDAVAELAASASVRESVELPAPSTRGTYHYGACVDAVPAETDATNNCSTSVKVTVQATAKEPGEQGQQDLVVTSPSVSDSAPRAGTEFTLSVTVKNGGRAAAAAATLRYYRSGDAIITTSDTEVGTDAVARLAPSGSASQSVELTAPLTPGTYHYGACVDAVPDESDTTTHCSTSVPVTVPEPRFPDLRVTSPSVSDTRPVIGASFTLSATVRNDGGGTAASTTLHYYRSTDATITRSDTEVGTDAVAGLAAAGSRSQSVELTAPSTQGTYYYGACVYAVAGESNATNNCSTSVPVEVQATVTTPHGQPDLAMPSVTVSDSRPITGTGFTLSATVTNDGDGASAGTTLRFYRSTDATITTSDTQVAAGAIAITGLGAGGSSAKSVSLTAPATAGAYYYGACVDAVTDESDTGNNCSASVEVDAEAPKYPDLAVGTPTADDTSPETGATITLSATVSNAGDGRSEATTLRYYRSNDATITTSDTQVGTDAIGTLAASGSSAKSISLTAPATAGTYYYGACVDAVTDESDTTNNCSTPVTVAVTVPQPKPDLVVRSPSVDDSTPAAGGAVTLSASVENDGGAAAAATTLRYYRSTDATIATTDTQVGTDAVVELAAADTSSQSVDLTAPDTAGTYYYGACVDAVIGESDTTNNCSSSVAVEVDPNDDHGDTKDTATTVVPATVTTAQEPIAGHLETEGDVDYFRVVANPGETVSAVLDASTQPENIAFGASITTETESSDESTSTTVYVRVRARNGTPRYDLAIWLRDANDPKDTTFDIDLMYSTTTKPSASQKATIRAAADTWESVITEGPEARLIAVSNMCLKGNTHDFGSFVDDLLIDIRVESIDGAGGVWASAGTCTIRTDTNGLPYTSVVTFDSADINRLSSGNLRILALHEIGHALGFGTLNKWYDSLVNSARDYLRNNPESTTLPDTHFSGTAAVSAFNEIADSYTSGKVPVENDTQSYGSGSLDGHWRESVFGSELMTSTVSTSEKFSKVTIAALADLGYSVDYTQAESYTLPGSSALHRSPLDIRDEVRRGPVTRVPFRDQQIVLIPP
ncbi:MAG: hypothetical protein OXC31_00565 [Spirochaetaceae bacterium]|nr:hypothetical protein [Spirochaetaceae bacterium]